MAPLERHAVHIGERGKIVIPAPVRHRLGLETGTALTLTVSEDGTITLVSRAALVSRLEGSVVGADDDAGGRDLLGSLLALRRGGR